MGAPLRILAAAALLLTGTLLAAPQQASAQTVSEPTTLLIMGVNAPPDTDVDAGVRPTALTVMHIDPSTGSCSNLAIPSDSLAELPGYGETKIRHALMVGGIPFQELVTETYLGIEIDHYVLVDFTGFQSLVDSVGGINVDVAPDLTSPSIPTAGVQSVDGTQALGHARYGGGSDFVRIQRQQALIRGIIGELDGLNLVTKGNDLLPVVQDHVRSDLGIQEMAELGNYFNDHCSSGAMQMDTIPGDIVYGPIVDPLFNVPLSYVVSDPAVVQQKVDALLAS
jgi:LCP family protein required for cell wall assembly